MDGRKTWSSRSESRSRRACSQCLYERAGSAASNEPLPRMGLCYIVSNIRSCQYVNKRGRRSDESHATDRFRPSGSATVSLWPVHSNSCLAEACRTGTLPPLAPPAGRKANSLGLDKGFTHSNGGGGVVLMEVSEGRDGDYEFEVSMETPLLRRAGAKLPRVEAATLRPFPSLASKFSPLTAPPSHTPYLQAWTAHTKLNEWRTASRFIISTYKPHEYSTSGLRHACTCSTGSETRCR